MLKLMEESSSQKFFWDEENGIVKIEQLGNVLNLEDAIESINLRENIKNKLGKNKIRVLLDLGSNSIQISREARQYFANERTASIQHATAMIAHSSITMMIANFFMGFNKPPGPTKMFSNADNAIIWLKQFDGE